MSNINIKSEDIHSFLSILSSNILAYEEDITYEDALNLINGILQGVYIINDAKTIDLLHDVTFSITYSFRKDTLQLLVKKESIGTISFVLIINKKDLYTTQYYKDLISLLKNLIEYKLVAEEYRDYNKLMQLLQTVMNTPKDELINKINESTCNNLINMINSSKNKLTIDYQRRIDQAYAELERAIDNMNTYKRKYEKALAINNTFITSNESIVTDLFNYYNKNKNLYEMWMNDTGTKYQIVMFTSFIKTNYTVGENVIDAYTDNPGGCLSHLSSSIKNILKDAMKDRERYILMQVPCRIEITIPYNDLSVDNISWRVQYFTDEYGYTNVHYTSFSCLGGFKVDINEAIQSKNLMQLTALILQYIQTINLNDVAGRNWITHKNQLVYDKVDNKYYQICYPDSILEADKYIDNKLSYINKFKQKGPVNRHSKGDIK